MTSVAAFNPTQPAWLGSLPEHWSTPPLRRLARIENGQDYKHIEVDEGGYPVIGSGGVFARAGAYLCEGPSVLLGRKGTVDRPQYVDEPFWAVDTSFFTLVERDVSTRFLFYFALTIPFGYFEAGTALPSMIKSNLYTIRCPLPRLDEQFAIADFLDRETERIDALVAKKQRLIELLQEKRTALISHAVTKGLDPDAPMKHSGIEWLGVIPAHWHAHRLFRIAKMESGHTPDRQRSEFWVDCLIPWVSLYDTKYLETHEYIEETANKINALGLAGSSARMLPQGTVVFSRDATIGRCGIAAMPLAVSQHFIAWVCGAGLLPEYLLFVLRSMTQELERHTMGSTLKTIGLPDVKRLAVPLPPVGEQRGILEWLGPETQVIDDLSVKVAEAVERLWEYRSALITAAVTGQVDVSTR